MTTSGSKTNSWDFLALGLSLYLVTDDRRQN